MKIQINGVILILSCQKYRNSRLKEFKLNSSFNYVWGMKRSGYRLRNKINKSKLIYLEDGFIHSYGMRKSRVPFSICFDKNA